MNIREVELSWYRKNGKHDERIAKDSNGNEYVIGDDSWNSNPKNKDQHEFVDPDMGFVM
ncbi:MAG: hypothetical protein WAW61_22285 [Methylococcaceae bacterium]